MKAIVVRGDFTDAEFAELVALIRRLDSARAGATFQIAAVDPTIDALDIADQILRQAVPEQEGRQTEWFKFKHGQRI